MARCRLSWFIAFVIVAAPSVSFAQEKAAAKPALPKLVKIVHVETGKMLSIADSSVDDEAAAVLVKEEPAKDAAKDAKNAAQEKKTKAAQWKLDKDGENWKITNRNSGKVLDVTGFSTDEGTVIIQYGEKTEGNDNQRWSWVGVKVDEAKPADTAKSTDGRSADGAKSADAAKSTDAAKATDAKAVAKPADAAPEGRFKSKSSSLVLDADSDGTVVQRNLNAKAKSQVWRIVEVKE